MACLFKLPNDPNSRARSKNAQPRDPNSRDSASDVDLNFVATPRGAAAPASLFSPTSTTEFTPTSTTEDANRDAAATSQLFTPTSTTEAEANRTAAAASEAEPLAAPDAKKNPKASPRKRKLSTKRCSANSTDSLFEKDTELDATEDDDDAAHVPVELTEPGPDECPVESAALADTPKTREADTPKTAEADTPKTIEAGAQAERLADNSVFYETGKNAELNETCFNFAFPL